MSIVTKSTGSRVILFSKASSAMPSVGVLRVTMVIEIIVLTVCAILTPVCGHDDQLACGKRQVQQFALPRIHHGAAAKQGDWPWHVAIYLPIGNKPSYACGGSIIGRNTILSSAHCFVAFNRLVNEDQITVYVGRADLSEITRSLPGLKVSKLITHPEFKIYGGAAHDIAILKVSPDIVMTQTVQPVCLWSMGGNHSQIVGKTGTVVGYGRAENDQLPGFLQDATVTVLDGYTCIENDRGTYGNLLTSDMYCAGEQQGVSPCNGDSGGGMFFDIDGTWYIGGIISFIAKRPNTNLCDPSKYTVFTFVSKYRQWILQYTDKSRRSTSLEPCKDRTIRKDRMCNMAFRFDHAFLLVGLTANIIRVPLNGEECFKIARSEKLGGFDRDCVEGRIYWSDNEARQIVRANYDGTDREPFITEDIGWLEGIAVDWISRRLYWADRKKKVIEVASLDNPTVRTVLISGNLSYQFGIAVDPYNSKLYWSDLNREGAKIEWSNLDGTERQLLIGWPHVKGPYSLQVSMATGELCYADRDSQKIACMDPYSKQVRTIASNLSSPVGLAATDELFYWTDFSTEKIESVNQSGVRQKAITSSVFKNDLMYGTTAVTDKCPFFYSPCAMNNGECPDKTICLVNPRAPLGKTCK